MSEYGDFERQKMAEAAGIEEPCGWEEFCCWVIACVIVIGICIVGIFALNRLEEFGRPEFVRPCKGTVEACRNIQAAINQEASH